MLRFFKQNCLFTKLASVNLLSKVGDRLFYTAMLTTASLLPESSIAVMVVSASETIPILLSVFVGVVADRQAKKIKFLVQSLLFRAIMYLGIGVVFCYHSTLTLLLIVSLLNLLSDISGNYSSALFAPFTKKLISAKDMEEAQGILSLASQLVNVLATFLGSVLLIVLSKSLLAVGNALIFIIVAGAFLRMSPQLRKTENTITVSHSNSIFKAIHTSLGLFFKDRELTINLLQLCLLNGFFGGLVPIFTLFIKENKTLAIFSAPIKISLLSGLITLAMIGGNLLGARVLRRQSISNLTLIADVFILLTSLGFLFNSFYLILLASGLLSFLLGIISPRFCAEIVNRSPVERLGGIITTINACLVIAPPLTSMIFPILSNLDIKFAYYGFLIYGAFLILSRLKFFQSHKS